MPARYDRRSFLAGLILAACSGTKRGPVSNGSQLLVANYPFFIDGSTNRDFTAATGIDVEYHESAHPDQVVGTDVYVASGGSGPVWATTMVGIAAPPAVNISTCAQLFQPEFFGRVSLPVDMQQSLGIALLADRVDPSRVTYDQAAATAGRLVNSVRLGQVVIGDSRDVTVSRASDTIGTDRAFVVPQEGGLVFTDVLTIPRDATNPVEAQHYIDFVNEPAHLAERLRVVPTVIPADLDPIAEQIIRRDAPAILDDPRRNPTAEVRARLRRFRTLSADEQTQFDALFNGVVHAAG